MKKAIIIISSIAIVGGAILAINHLAKKDSDKTDVSVITEENNSVASNEIESSATQEITELTTTVNNDMLPLKTEVISFDDIPWSLPIQVYSKSADKYNISYKVNDSTPLGTGYSVYIDFYFEGEDPYDYHLTIFDGENTYAYVCGVYNSGFSMAFETRDPVPTMDAPLSLELTIEDNRR